jgi:hypothetical protein
VKKNVNGIFNQGNIEIIPEINWSTFFVADMKHAYLLSDKPTTGN